MVKGTQKKQWCIGGMYLAVTALVYYKTIFLGFFSDDYHFLSVISNADNVWYFFLSNNVGEVFGGSYGPVLDVLWFFQYHLFGMHAWMYHIVVLLVYATTAYTVHKIGELFTGKPGVGYIAGLLFLLIQNHTSSVAWIAVMPHLWATLFFVIALYGYSMYSKGANSWWYVCALVSITLSLFTKESAIMFPLVFFCADIYFSAIGSLKQKCITATKRILPFVLVLFLYLIIRQSIVGYVIGYYGDQTSTRETYSHIFSLAALLFSGDLLYGEKVTQMIQLVLVFFEGIVVFHVVAKHMHMFIELSVSMLFGSPYRQYAVSFILGKIWWVCVAGIVGVSGVFFFLQKKERTVFSFFFLSYCAISVPFTALLFDQTSNSGERYGYVMSVFFCLLFAQLITYFFWKHTYVYGTILCILCGGLFLQHNTKLLVWQQSAAVREHILADIVAANISPKDYVVFVGLPDNIAGVELMRNAVFEMIHLERSRQKMSGERVPLYTEPKRLEAVGPVVYVEELGDGQFVILPHKEDNRYFTGFRTFKSGVGSFYLDNFRHKDHSGTAIRFTIHKHVPQEEGYDRLILAYYDGESLRFHPIALN